MTAHALILIVEDDAHSAFILKTILSQYGYEILPIAVDSTSALKQVDNKKPDLILMDITLPGQLDGIEVAKRIKQKWDIPIIYLTGHSSEGIIERVKETTPFGFIIKPYDPKSVLVTTEMALHKAEIERESKETKHRLAVTLGTLRDPIFSTDAHGNINYLNTAAQKLLDRPLAEVLGSQFDRQLTFYPLNAQAKAVPSFTNFCCKNIKDTPSSEVTFFDKHRNLRYAYIQVNPLLDFYHVLQGYVISLNDFTEQYHYEQNNRKLASALTNSHEGVIIAELNNHAWEIEYINQGLSQMLAYPANELKGQALSKLFCEGFEKNICEALNRRSAYSADTPMQRLDGKTIYTHWNLTPSSNDNNYVVITISDVTQLRQLEDNLRQKQKIEAIGRIASGIAHDFNNLLSVINGYSELILSTMPPEQTSYAHVKNIYEAGHKGALLVKQLMTFSRQSKKRERIPIDLKTSTHETLHMLEHWIGNNIQFFTHWDENLWMICSQETYIDQILVNLCVNARDALKNGGSIHISFENFTGVPNDLPYGNYVKLSVRDTGTGIDEETQKKIFEPFFTTKPIGQGTGLGLSCIYGLVKQHEGSIQVFSEKGKGTTFTIYLPAIQQKLEEKSTHTSEEAALKRKIFLFQLPEIVSHCLYQYLCLQNEYPQIVEGLPSQLAPIDIIVSPTSVATTLPGAQVIRIDNDIKQRGPLTATHPNAIDEILKQIQSIPISSCPSVNQ